MASSVTCTRAWKVSVQCFNTPACKQMLLHPRHVEEELCRKRKVKLDDAALTKYFVCPRYCWRGSKVPVSYYKTVRCDCGNSMNNEIYLQGNKFGVEESGNEGRYKALISDNLLYMPNHPKRLLECFEDHGIKCTSQLEEKIVTVGLEQLRSHACYFLLKKQVGVRVGAMKQPLISSTKESTGKVTPLTVDVLVRKSDSRILFAIADKDFVDLLFTFLTLPMIGFPYRFDGHWLAVQSYELPPYYSGHCLLPNFNAQDPPSLVYFRTQITGSKPLLKRSNRAGHKEALICLIDPKSAVRDSTNSNGGYAKDEELFLVSDDLVVKHLASASTVSLRIVLERKWDGDNLCLTCNALIAMEWI